MTAGKFRSLYKYSWKWLSSRSASHKILQIFYPNILQIFYTNILSKCFTNIFQVSYPNILVNDSSQGALHSQAGTIFKCWFPDSFLMMQCTLYSGIAPLGVGGINACLDIWVMPKCRVHHRKRVFPYTSCIEPLWLVVCLVSGSHDQGISKAWNKISSGFI